MSVKTDPTLYNSDFERNRLDRYWTEHPATAGFLKEMGWAGMNLWDPCCGRGDIAGVCKVFGHLPFMSDIDISEVDTRQTRKLAIPVEQLDFLSGEAPGFMIDNEIDGIVTNTPFGDMAERFVRHALTFQNIQRFAFLLRAEWDHASTRSDLFRKQPFAAEVVLTWRLRWDWWLSEEEKRARKIAAGKDPDVEHSPRHNFSWFVWDRGHTGRAQKYYAIKDKEK